jgi:hypothetical protein
MPVIVRSTNTMNVYTKLRVGLDSIQLKCNRDTIFCDKFCQYLRLSGNIIDYSGSSFIIILIFYICALFVSYSDCFLSRKSFLFVLHRSIMRVKRISVLSKQIF